MMNRHIYQDREKLKQQIRHEEIKLLYGGTSFSFTAAIVISLIIYVVLYDHVVSVFNLNIWLASILSVMFIRTIDSYRFAKKSTYQQLKDSWRIRFFVGTAAAGLCWGLLPWLGYSTDIEYFAFIIVCQVGIIAGSLSTLSYRWESLALFLLPSGLLLIAKLLLDDQNFSNVTSIVLAVFIFFSLFAGIRIFKNTQQNIQLRIEADNREQAIGIMHQKQTLHLQNTPLAIVEFSRDLNITEWNTAAQEVFGYTRDEAINENIIRLIIPRDSSLDAEKIWERLLNHEALTGTIFKNKTKHGKPILCEWFVTPITNEKNEIVSIAAMAMDITEKKQIEEAILKSKEEAEKANHAKSDFLSNMSHELRTPLNAILGFTQLLNYEKKLSTEQQSHLSEINSAGNLLLELVNQILDLSRIEKGHLQLSMEKADLSSIFKKCHSMITPLALKNNITLNIETQINGYVIADHTRLKQVMLNLLSNAIKYNKDQGSITLDVFQKENNVIRISIIDTGKGIPEEFIDEIFQPFNRLSTDSTIEGTGIGLSISKQLIEMMNGSIGVVSKVNEGSTFWIELSGDLNTTETREPGTGSHKTLELENSAQQNNNILVAEDNPTNQVLILTQLKSLGYNVDLVANGQEALSKLATRTYDLLITDCNMPIIDGYNLVKKIREGGNKILPIIAITADAFPEKKKQCLEVGVNEHLIKPIDISTLKKAIEKHLH